MYLVYMNFVNEDQQYMPVHVLCPDRHEARKIAAMGQRHGLTPTGRLVQYILFESDGEITADVTAQGYTYSAAEFADRWQDVKPQPPKRQQEYEYLVIDLDGHTTDDWTHELDAWARRGFDLVNVVEHGGKLRAFLRTPRP